MDILAVKKLKNTIRNNKIESKDICLKCNGKLDELFVCKTCGNTSYIPAKKRISIISDENTFKELNFNKIDISKKCNYEDKINKAKEKTNLDEAIVIGTCLIGGIKVVLGIMDSKFMMGTLSVSVGETITRAFEYATYNELPVILFCASGGARIQEGLFSLVQMAKVSATIKRHSDKGLLYISCLTNPTMGGVTASFGLYGDINIAEKDSQIGFAGKSIIENLYNKVLDNDFQSEKYNENNGMIDIIADRKDIRNILIDLLKIINNNNNVVKFEKNTKNKPKTNDDLLEILKNVRDIDRFKGKDYLIDIFDKYIELKGDRINSNDTSILSGVGYIENNSFVFNIQNKGRTLNENKETNYGLTRPEGYRKVIRISKLAEKFNIPIINIIDSNGADPSIYSEENGQAIAIADCLYTFSDLKTIIISIVVGEGTSGGALALSVCDSIGMLEKSIYSVISPEAYLKIMHKEENVSSELLKSMRFTANDLYEDKIIDEIISENDDLDYNVNNIKKFILNKYEMLRKQDIQELVSNRYERIRNWDIVAKEEGNNESIYFYRTR